MLNHATTACRLRCIRRRGLLISKADPSAKIRGIWLHSPALSSWAVLHTQRKHGARLAEVVVVEVRVPRSKLTRFRRELWFVRQDLAPACLGKTFAGATFGAAAL
jgi:hypothetical protein